MHQLPNGPLARLARFSYRRRRLTLLLWLAGAAALMAVGFANTAESDNDFSGGSTEAARAQELLERHFPGREGDAITLAIRAEQGLDDPAVRAEVGAAVTRLKETPHVSSVSAPFDVPQQISPDRKTAFATAQLDVPSDEMPVEPVRELLADVRAEPPDKVRLELGGASVTAAEAPEGGSSEAVGLLAAVVILLIAFGSVLAMGLPVLTALLGIGTGMAIIGLLGHVQPAPDFAPIVAVMIGLGVGIDYALFIVTRYREALAAGADPEQATVTAITTAGRAVLFAGTTVVIALAGLFVMQERLLNAVAVAAGVTVLMTMITAVTLLPALLGFTGRNIDRLRIPALGRARRPLAERWARAVQRRPAVAALVAGGLLLALATPALAMRLGLPDSSTQAHDSSAYASHRILAEGFGAGYDAPLVMVAQAGPGGGGDPSRVAEAVRRTPGVAAVTPPQPSPDGKATLFIAYPKTAGLDEETSDLVHRLRADVVPAATAGTGLRVLVGGPNAASIDFAESVEQRLPWLVAVVVGLSLVLLVALVRSVTIALQAAVMNLLSVAAAYGVLTAVVQWGWGGALLGFPSEMPVATWVPLMMFPILFGLSMDYEVFLVSRIREIYGQGVPTREAVAQGLAKTARVITAAAAIMVTVFAAVLLGADIAVKQIGLGLAVAVLIDATIVRLVLVPALMELFGKANWWLPKALDRALPGRSTVSAG
jgi:putative drug exporter of the RND superfamily